MSNPLSCDRQSGDFLPLNTQNDTEVNLIMRIKKWGTKIASKGVWRVGVLGELGDLGIVGVCVSQKITELIELSVLPQNSLLSKLFGLLPGVLFFC